MFQGQFMQEKDEDILAQNHKIALVISPDLDIGQAANRSAVLASGLAAHHPEIIGEDILTADGIRLPGFTKVPIVVLSAKDSASINILSEKGRKLGCTVLIFLTRAQGLRSYQAYIASVGKTPAENLDVDAFIIYGAKKAVNKVTGNLPILR